MRLYLVRHGETAWNQERRCQGISDIDLNDTGRHQAELAANSLKDVPFRAIYTSSLRRAIETAEIINRFHGVNISVEPDLRELNQGKFEGKTFQELFENYGPDLEVWWKSPANFRMPEGGETLAELQDRAWKVVQRIREDHQEGEIGIIAHNFVNIVIISKVLGLDLDKFRRLRQEPSAVNIVEFNQGRSPCIIALNDVSHLRSTSS